MFKTHWWSEIISLFPRVDTRLIPYIVKHTIDLRYLHTIYILYTILQYDTPNSSKSKTFKHTIYTIHTPYKTHTFFSLYSPFLSLLSSIILFLFSLLFFISPHNNNKNNTLTDNIHSPITIHPPNAPNTPNTLTTLHLCLNNLNQHDSVRKLQLNSIIHL